MSAFAIEHHVHDDDGIMTDHIENDPVSTWGADGALDASLIQDATWPDWWGLRGRALPGNPG